MQFAGPLNPGDMAVRTNEVAPGVAALLRKESRNNRGIYELPVAKPENPDFYNMSLDNVQSQLRNFARTINTLAPEGESLAYISPEEAGILKLLGGAGEPEPVTGIPSFYITDGKEGGGISKGMIDRARNLRAARERTKNLPQLPDRDKPQGPSETYGGSQDPNQFDYVPMIAGGIGEKEFDKDTELKDKAAQQALINAYVKNTAPLMQQDASGKFRFEDAGTSQAGLDALQGLAALRGQANNTLFSSDFNKMFNQALKDEGMVKENIFGDYTTEEGKMLKQALGGGSSGIGNLLSSIGLTGLLSNLFNTDDLTLEERLRRQKMVKEAVERQQKNRGGDNNQQTMKADTEEKEEEEDDKDTEIDFFSNLQRRFNMPITLESLRNRFMTGDPNRQNLLENLSDAVDRAKEENEAST